MAVSNGCHDYARFSRLKQKLKKSCYLQFKSSGSWRGVYLKILKLSIWRLPFQKVNFFMFFFRYIISCKNWIQQNFENSLRQKFELCLWIVQKKKFDLIRSIHFAQSWQPTWKNSFEKSTFKVLERDKIRLSWTYV